MSSSKPPSPARSGPRRNGKANGARRRGRAPDAGVQLHLLQNTIASLQLRLSVLAADPTCQWAQQDNIAALLKISGEALTQTRELRQTINRPPRGQRRGPG